MQSNGGDLPAPGGLPAVARKKADQSMARSIQIVRAQFGGRADFGACDASSYVRAQCENRSSCTVPVTDGICQIPATSLAPLIPRLQVSYRCTATEKTRTKGADKPFAVRLACGTAAP